MDEHQQYAQRILAVSKHWSSEEARLERELFQLYQRYLVALGKAPARPKEFRQGESLAEALQKLEAISRGSAVVPRPATPAEKVELLEPQIKNVADRLNRVYEQWHTNIRTVPPPRDLPEGWLERWLTKYGTIGMKNFIYRSLNLRGVVVTKRVIITYGGVKIVTRQPTHDKEATVHGLKIELAW